MEIHETCPGHAWDREERTGVIAINRSVLWTICRCREFAGDREHHMPISCSRPAIPSLTQVEDTRALHFFFLLGQSETSLRRRFWRCYINLENPSSSSFSYVLFLLLSSWSIRETEETGKEVALGSCCESLGRHWGGPCVSLSISTPS